MNTSRRCTLAAGLGLLGSAVIPILAKAQPDYPDKIIKFVIPTSVGGGYDTMMRIIGQKITEAWGQPTIVDARPGASGAIAAAFVAKAAPDGYTLLLGYSALISNLLLQQNPSYRLEEFTPIGMVALAPIAIGVRKSLGVNTLQEYVALAKSRPGVLSYGSYGPGSGGHFVGELLNMAADINTLHIPYKGEASALQDLLAGQIDAAVVSLGGVTRYPEKIQPLAVSSPSRFPLYPEVPTFAEAGFPGRQHAGHGRPVRTSRNAQSSRRQTGGGDGAHRQAAGRCIQDSGARLRAGRMEDRTNCRLS